MVWKQIDLFKDHLIQQKIYCRLIKSVHVELVGEHESVSVRLCLSSVGGELDDTGIGVVNLLGKC